MIKRNFLKPVSVVLAALASATSWASSQNSSAPAPLVPENARTNVADAVVNPVTLGESRDILFRQGEDLFKFILQRSESGQSFAYHYSHSSHGSHASHSSHSSHYSGR